MKDNDPMHPEATVEQGTRDRPPAMGAARPGRILLRPLWLPARAYAAVPWIYLGTGSAALAGGLYLPDDSWYLPYLALGGLALLRTAVGIARMRRRLHGRRQRQPA